MLSNFYEITSKIYNHNIHFCRSCIQRRCENDKKAPVGEIPFAIAGDSRIYVTAFVNGSDSLRFLVDTGASSIVLNTNSPKLKGLIHNGELADNLGTSGENSVEYSNDNSVKVGTIQYDKAVALIFHILPNIGMEFLD